MDLEGDWAAAGKSSARGEVDLFYQIEQSDIVALLVDAGTCDDGEKIALGHDGRQLMCDTSAARDSRRAFQSISEGLPVA